jgi:cation transport ATPase
MVIIAAFTLSVAVTALMLTLTHGHRLHVAHVVIATALFLLIAVYLRKSAQLASTAPLRELRERFAADETLAVGEVAVVKPNSVIPCDGEIISGETRVDESQLSGARALVQKSVGDRVYRGTINHGGGLEVRVAAPLCVVAEAVTVGQLPCFNVCAGVLAKSGIFVRDSGALTALAGAKTLAVRGNSPEREGYAATRDALEKMGITLVDGESDAITLCDFRDFDGSADAMLTHNKITHALKAVYIARVFAKAARLAAIRAAVAVIAAAALTAFGQFMFAGMVAAIWAAFEVLDVRRLERKTARLSFEKVTGKA